MTIFRFQENDPFSPIHYSYEMDTVLCRHDGPFGEVAVAEHKFFGRVLILDGVVQLTERDEHYYHEMLVHVPLHLHPQPENVLIIGGGDGGTLREVLKHAEVKRAVLAEIDLSVIETSKRFLPTLSTGFSDPRVEIRIGDGAEYVAESRDAFDVILVDCTDPVGPATSLVTEEFFTNASKALKAEGLLVAQTESLHFHLDFIKETQRKLRASFRYADLYAVSLATYAGNWWTFSLGSKSLDPRSVARSPRIETKYYAEDVHRNAFLPLSVKKKMVGA